MGDRQGHNAKEVVSGDLAFCLSPPLLDASFWAKGALPMGSWLPGMDWAGTDGDSQAVSGDGGLLGDTALPWVVCPSLQALSLPRPCFPGPRADSDCGATFQSRSHSYKPGGHLLGACQAACK